MLIPIAKIVVQNRIRKDFGDISELAKDIEENGLINPPVVNKNYVLLAGERRLRACESLGWSQIPVTMMDTRDAEHELNIEISENDVRKGFTKSERVDYMKRLLRIESAKAEERKHLGQKSDEGARADDATAKRFGISRDTIRREVQLAENRELLDASDFAEWDEGRLSTNKAYQKLKARLAELEAKRQQRPEVKEVRVEVEPSDYGALKKEVQEARRQAQRAEQDYEGIRKKWMDSQDKLRQLESIVGADKAKKDADRDIRYFTDATNDYIRRYGGHVWVFNEFQNLDETLKQDFIKAILALDSFAQQIISNLGGGLNEQ